MAELRCCIWPGQRHDAFGTLPRRRIPVEGALCSCGEHARTLPVLTLAPTSAPSPHQVMRLVGLSIVGTFVVDRVVTAIFAPDIFRIMLQQAR